MLLLLFVIPISYALARYRFVSGKERYIKEMFAECGENCYIELPFRANWGGKNVHFGNGVYANFNLTLVDDGDIYIDDKVMFGPNVTIATANPPHRSRTSRKSHAVQ